MYYNKIISFNILCYFCDELKLCYMKTKETMTKKEIAFKERMAKQRIKRGYCDEDVWSIDFWFCKTIAPMLRQLAKTSHGCPLLDENGDVIYKENTSSEELDIYAKRWEDTLLHMAFLADEMQEDTCSMINPFKKENDRIHKTFTKKYDAPLEINEGDVVYCYAISEEGYITYTNIYKRFPATPPAEIQY